MAGDMSDGFRDLTEARKKRHQEWHKKNLRILEEQTEFPYKIDQNGETCLFRINGKPRINFYPSTGRWTNIETKQVMSGGATAFLRWFKKEQSHA